MFANLFKKYNPAQPRAPKGTANGGQWVAEGAGVTAALFERLTKPDGGFTYHAVTGKEPTEGFAVSPYPERSIALGAKSLTFDALVDYAVKNRDLFSRPDHYMGAWHDPVTDKVFLDVSLVTDRKKAEAAALAHDQIAYFDIKAGKSVTVNRQATSGGTVKGDDDGTGQADGTALAAWRRVFGRAGTGDAVQKYNGTRADAAGIGTSESQVGEKPKLDLAVAFKYDPSQPRAPAGSEEGGQWVSTAARAGHPASSLSKDQKIYTDEERERLADRYLRQLLSAEEYQQFKASLDEVNRMVAEGKETKVLHSNEKVLGKNGWEGKNGYTAERLALHGKILAGIFTEALDKALPEAGQAPQLYVLGGKGGSGKSQFGTKGVGALKLYDDSKALVLDADQFKTALAIADGVAVKDSGGNPSVGKYAALYHKESGDLFDKAVVAARSFGLNTVMDVTLASPHTHRVELFKKAGYEVTGMYMYLPKEEAAKRAITRARDGGTMNGRMVPPDYVLKSVNNEKSFDKLLSLADRAVVYHNDVPRGAAPVKVWPETGEWWTRTAKKSLGFIFKYDPEQPRAPKGTPDGGKWVDKSGPHSVPLHDGRTYVDFNPMAFENKAAIDEFVARHESIINKLTVKERVALDFYTESGYRPINKYIGAGKLEAPAPTPGEFALGKKDPVLENTIASLDSALSKSTLGTDVVLYRDMAAQHLTRQLGFELEAGKAMHQFIKFSEADLVGKVYEEKAFASASLLNRDFGLQSTAYKARVTIHAKKESKGLYVAPISTAAYEREVLLPRNSRFLIRSVRRVNDDPYNVYVDADLL